MDGVFRRLFGYISPYRGRFIAAVVFGALAGLCNGILIFVLKSVFTIVLPIEGATSRDFQPFEDIPWEPLQNLQITRPDLPPEKEWIFVVSICLFVPAILTIGGLFTFLHQYLMLWLNNRVLYNLRDDAFSSIINQPLGFFHEVRQGELVHSVSMQTRTSADSGVNFLSAMIKHPIAIVSVLIALLSIDWFFTLFAFTVFPVAVLPVAMIARKIRKAGRREEVAAEGMMVTMQESFDGIRLIKAHDREDFQRERFNQGSRSLLQWIMHWKKAMEISAPLMEVIASLGLSLALIHAWTSEMEPGEFIVLTMAIASMYPHAKSLGRIHLQLQRCAVSASRVFRLIDRKPEIIDREDAIELKDVGKGFELKGVGFSYQPDVPVLSDINLAFERGKRYALVGKSGSGKSTLLSLMMRFYDPDEGVISLGGRDIREYTQNSLRDQIGLVSQDVFHFHDTVRENLRYGRLDATDAEIEAAAKAANAEDFIRELPEGYDTVLGDKARNLSGGQQQRLAIARAILRDAPILFLDEATSALDTESERNVQEAIETLGEGKTIVAIAHRLSTVLNSEQIIVMADGRVVDKGRHAELLERCPVYQKLYELQFRE